MVELIGSEKQVKWANDIRNKEVEYLNEVVNNVKYEYVKHIGVNDEDIVEQFKSGADEFNKAVNEVKLTLDTLNNETSAKFIIENREKLAENVARNTLKISIRILLNYYTNQKYSEQCVREEKEKRAERKIRIGES